MNEDGSLISDTFEFIIRADDSTQSIDTNVIIHVSYNYIYIYIYIYIYYIKILDAY